MSCSIGSIFAASKPPSKARQATARAVTAAGSSVRRAQQHTYKQHGDARHDESGVGCRVMKARQRKRGSQRQQQQHHGAPAILGVSRRLSKIPAAAARSTDPNIQPLQLPFKHNAESISRLGLLHSLPLSLSEVLLGPPDRLSAFSEPLRVDFERVPGHLRRLSTRSPIDCLRFEPYESSDPISRPTRPSTPSFETEIQSTKCRHLWQNMIFVFGH